MHVVSNMRLIPQSMTMSCWYASAQMVINWRRQSKQMTEARFVDPSEDAQAISLRDSNNGIANPAIIAFAKRLGLRHVPPMSPSEETLEKWLKAFGPLWVNGKTHIVVIAGIRPGEVLVYDPAPLNVGRIEWRSLSGWYVGGSSSSRDTGGDVETVFLHCPA